jgi:hypothetical protein
MFRWLSGGASAFKASAFVLEIHNSSNKPFLKPPFSHQGHQIITYLIRCPEAQHAIALPYALLSELTVGYGAVNRSQAQTCWWPQIL